MDIALDTNVLAYAEGVGDARRQALALELIERLPSAALVLRPAGKKPGKALLALEAAFRALPTPVIGYVHDDAYHLDLRCLEAPDEARFVAQLGSLKAVLA